MMQINSPLRFSTKGNKVAIASCPKGSEYPFFNEYATSIVNKLQEKVCGNILTAFKKVITENAVFKGEFEEEVKATNKNLKISDNDIIPNNTKITLYYLLLFACTHEIYLSKIKIM